MPGQPIDWRRARHPKFDDSPRHEITDALAKEDQEFLERQAAIKRKQTKFVRSTPKERALRRLMEKPETVQERRLRTILAALSGGKLLFDLTPSHDASYRLFQRADVRLRVKIDRAMRRQLIVISPGERASFDWITVSLAPGALEDHYAAVLASRLREIISNQSHLRRTRNA